MPDKHGKVAASAPEFENIFGGNGGRRTDVQEKRRLHPNVNCRLQTVCSLARCCCCCYGGAMRKSGLPKPIAKCDIPIRVQSQATPSFAFAMSISVAIYRTTCISPTTIAQPVDMHRHPQK